MMMFRSGAQYGEHSAILAAILYGPHRVLVGSVGLYKSVKEKIFRALHHCFIDLLNLKELC